jgi:ribulose-bisphosphate carboxylase large chain
MSTAHIDYSNRPTDSDYIVVRYLLRPKDTHGIEEVIEDFVLELKGNSWTDLPVDYLTRVKSYESYVHELTINDVSNYAYMSIGFNADNFDFELGGVAQILAIVAGDNISTKKLESIRIVDLFLPESVKVQFKGPANGIEAIRDLYRTPKAPILQMILKPRFGLTAEEYAHIAYRCGVAGVQAVRDDQMLISTSYCRFQQKVDSIVYALKRAEDKVGKKILYYPNITISHRHIPRIVDNLREKGIQALTINCIHEGMGVIEYLREYAPDFIIQAHRSGYVLLSNNLHYSISYSVLAQLMNLAGADEVHVGSIFGRFDVKKQETLKSLEFLRNPGSGLRGSLPIISGSVTPAIIPATIDAISHDVIFLAGSGILGHPKSMEAGVKAMKEMIDITMEASGIEDMLRNGRVSDDLLRALALWGYKPDGVKYDRRIHELALQNLAVKDQLDIAVKDRLRSVVEQYAQRFSDDEICILSSALDATGRTLAGNVGQITEKYLRKLTIHENIEYRQFFSAVSRLSEAGVFDHQLESGLDGIRKLYNKAKHKDIYILFREVLPSVDHLFAFFAWLEERKISIDGGVG